MRKKLSLLMVALIAVAAFAWAEAAIENSGNQGDSDKAINGKSYTLDGKFIAGKGGVQQGDMPDKGVKMRSNKGPVEFKVNAGYKITGFEFWGCGNTTTALVIKSVTVDSGDNLLSDDVTLPGKADGGGSGHFVLSDIGAEDNITITFAEGTSAQFVGTWKVTYEQTAVITQEITSVTLNGAALSETDLETLKSTKALTIDGTNLNGVGLLDVTLSSGGTTVSKTFEGTSAVYTFTINATDQYTVTVNNVVKTYSQQGIAVGYKKGETEAEGANSNTIMMDGITFAMVNDTKAFQYGSGKVTLGENDYVPLKLSTGSAVNVTFPEGKKATKVIVYGWSANGNGKIAEMKESAESEKSVDVANDIYYATNTASDIYPSVYEYELDNWESLYFNPGGSASQPFVVMDFVFADETGGDEPTIGSHWEKATSIAVGDVLLLTSEGTAGTTTWSKELKEFSSNIGQVEDYTDTPKGLQPLTVEEGNKSGTFAFKTVAGKYLAANSSNQLPVIDELNDKSSWTVTWEDDIPKIANVDITNRVLQYNSGSPRFACYTTTQKAVTLWKKVGSDPVETRIATTITLGEYATTAEVGAEYALPTATVTGVDGAPVENATITWSSSDTEVAEIAATYAGLNLKKAGKATITATYEGDNNYKGSTASFELTVTAAPYTSIAAMLADITSTQTTVAYKFENLLVTYVNGSNTYVHDGTNGFLFYGSNLGLVAGQKITGTVTGQLYTYNGLPEMSVNANGISVTVASENNEVTWTSIAPADLQNNINVPVTIENAVFVEAGNGKNLNFKVGEKDLVVYNNWSIDVNALEADKAYNLTGIGSVYAKSETTTYQLYLVSFEEAVLTSNTIWSSEDAVYATDISISAERFADATVGDKLHIEVLNTSTESIYNSCVKILNSDGKQLEDGVNVGLELDGTIVSFVLTGDILTQLKANGLKLGGYGYYSKQIELETTETTGSKKSIWVGRQETGNIEISSFHFANANDFAGVKKGDIIRVTLDATEWIEGSGWVNLQYKKVYDWIDTQNTDLVQITNTWNGEPVDILINSDELAAELNDAVNNHGAVVQLGESTVATQVELIIKEPMKGDANLDGEVTVTDAEMAVSFALETETPTAEQLKATDLNESGDVTVSDAVGIVNIALEISDEPVAGARAFEAGSNMLTQDGLALNLQNTTSFVAFQMDVTLDNGAVLNGVQLAERAQGLKATYNKVGENTWRIVAFSVAKNVITGSEGNLLTLDVTGNQSATISHIEFSDSAANAYELALSSNTTGINTVGNAQQSIDNAYDLSGRRINGNTKGLRIVNGKKVVIK